MTYLVPSGKGKKKHNTGFLPSVIIQGRPRAISNKSRKETALIRDCLTEITKFSQ